MCNHVRSHQSITVHVHGHAVACCMHVTVAPCSSVCPSVTCPTLPTRLVCGASDMLVHARDPCSHLAHLAYPFTPAVDLVIGPAYGAPPAWCLCLRGLAHAPVVAMRMSVCHTMGAVVPGPLHIDMPLHIYALCAPTVTRRFILCCLLVQPASRLVGRLQRHTYAM